jgi:hypothetical protein
MKSDFSFTPILAAVLVVLVAAPTMATTYTVNVMGDEILGVCDGMHCTLREAIIDANNNPGADTINIPAGEIVLVVDGGGLGTHEDYAATGDLDIRDDLTIIGQGPDSTVVDADGLDRVFHIPVAGLSVTLQGITITGGGGLTQAGDGGGGIWSEGSDLTLLLCDVVNNQTGVLLGVDYVGGGILSRDGGDLEMNWTTVSGNRATYSGGVNHWSSGRLRITDSTIASNVAVQAYGGIATASNDAIIQSSTIAFNTTIADPTTDVVGIYNAGTLDITASTIYGHDEGIAVMSYGSGGDVVTFTNSAVQGPCNGVSGYQTDGGNVFEDPNHALVGAGDIQVARLELASLGDHLGATETLMPYPFSPVIDHPGADASCPAFDQRGWSRPRDGDGDGNTHCDAGAVEYLTHEMLFGDNFEMGHALRWSSSSP